MTSFSIRLEACAMPDLKQRFAQTEVHAFTSAANGDVCVKLRTFSSILTAERESSDDLRRVHILWEVGSPKHIPAAPPKQEKAL